MKNQDENQDEKFLNNLNKNIACNIFKEQFDLINELPEKDRAKVLYLAVYNAFYNNSKNQNENQLEYQDENTYISISILLSLYNTLSNISKSVLNLLYKTITCKNYNKKWGGKRENAGRKKTVINDCKPTREEIEDYCKLIAKKIDIDEFIAYYDATDWKDELGKPVIWKRKVLKFAQSYNPEEAEKKKNIEVMEQWYQEQKAILAKKGIY